jgi:hypothetical protein
MDFVGLQWSIRFLGSTAPDSLGFNNRNNLVVLQFLGTIMIMTVLIMEPVSLELNKILTGHNSAADLAHTPMAHQTAIYVISDAVSVRMVAPELPEPHISWKCFVAKNFAVWRAPSNDAFQLQYHCEFDLHPSLPFRQ